jgi:hypothetical protein
MVAAKMDVGKWKVESGNWKIGIRKRSAAPEGRMRRLPDGGRLEEIRFGVASILAHLIVYTERPAETSSPGPRRLMKAPSRSTLSRKGERVIVGTGG